jgi:signal transduction histidine kinase/CheY-like chemotaxis protein
MNLKAMVSRWVTLGVSTAGDMERFLGVIFFLVIISASATVAIHAHNFTVAVSNGACCIGYLLVLRKLLQGWTLKLTCQWTSLIAALSLSFESWQNGGIYASTLSWFTVVIMANYFLVGRRAGLLWSLGALGIFLMQSSLPPNDAFAAHRVSSAMALTALIDYSASMLLVILVLMYYHQRNAVLFKELKVRQGKLQRQREELERTLSVRGRFMASLNHALRNPLNAILGLNSFLLANVHGKPRSAMVLEHTRQAADHLMALINEALDYTNEQNKPTQVHLEPVNLHQTLHNAFALFEPRMANAKLACSCYIDPRLPQWILTDRHRLTQILVNLLGNAVKFTASGSIRLRAEPGASDRLLFSVVDTGIGIAPDDQRKLFERFSQANGEIHSRFGGSGLGLTISLELSKLLGGMMGFESTPGQGSRFWLDLPARMVEAPATTEPAKSLDLHSGDKAWRFLVVDDHPVNRFLLRRVLVQRWPQARLEEAPDGLQALRACQEQDFDLILMDLVMPQMDGTEATKALRSSGNKHTQNVPIIGLTANVHPPDLAMFKAAGLDALMLKPFDSAALYAQIESLVALGSARQAAAPSPRPMAQNT